MTHMELFEEHLRKHFIVLNNFDSWMNQIYFEQLFYIWFLRRNEHLSKQINLYIPCFLFFFIISNARLPFKVFPSTAHWTG